MKSFVLVGMIVTILLNGCNTVEKPVEPEVIDKVAVVELVSEVPINSIELVTPIKCLEEVESVEVVEEETITKTSLGTYTLTAYCSCQKCCGKWAIGRPLDENGNEIVYTASGKVAQQGVTIAVDPNTIPLGSRVEINGNQYVAQDTGGAIKGNRIDVYFANHNDALTFGKQTAEVFMIKE